MPGGGGGKPHGCTCSGDGGPASGDGRGLRRCRLNGGRATEHERESTDGTCQLRCHDGFLRRVCLLVRFLPRASSISSKRGTNMGVGISFLSMQPARRSRIGWIDICQMSACPPIAACATMRKPRDLDVTDVMAEPPVSRPRGWFTAPGSSLHRWMTSSTKHMKSCRTGRLSRSFDLRRPRQIRDAEQKTG